MQDVDVIQRRRSDTSVAKFRICRWQRPCAASVMADFTLGKKCPCISEESLRCEQSLVTGFIIMIIRYLWPYGIQTLPGACLLDATV